MVILQLNEMQLLKLKKKKKGIRGMSLDTELRFHWWRDPAGTQQAAQVRI